MERLPTLPEPSRSTRAFANRGVAYLRQGKKSQAEEDFARCFALDASLRASLEEKIKAIEQQRVAQK